VRIDYGKLRHPARCQRAKVPRPGVSASLPCYNFIGRSTHTYRAANRELYIQPFV
jgi:hypothetical protein